MDKKLYQENFPYCNIILGPLGIVNIDNFIVDYFDEGERYIYLNDDIRGLYHAPDKKKIIKIKDFWPLIETTFENMQLFNISYAGLNPVLNPYFMAGGKPIKYDICIITDPFSFVVNNKNIKLTKFHIDKNYNDNSFSDYEKSILHFRDRGAILRMNHYAVDVLYFNGAATSNRTKDNCLKTAHLMLEKYPSYISSIKNNKNGFFSLRMKRIKSTLY